MTVTLSASYVPAEPLTVERSPRIRRGPAADQLEQGGTIGRAQDLRIWPGLRFVLLPADGGGVGCVPDRPRGRWGAVLLDPSRR